MVLVLYLFSSLVSWDLKISHKFHVYFHYRTIHFLSEEGFYNFCSWFDNQDWYYLEPVIGGTIYPGLIVMSAAISHALHFIHIINNIQNVFMSLAFLFFSFTILIKYHLSKVLKNAGAGLLAASIIAIVPEYISWSVDVFWVNEGIAVFCILLTYYTCWLRQQTLVSHIASQVCPSVAVG